MTASDGVSWDEPLVHDVAMRRDLPAGTVTFLFTDVEGSTKLLHAVGAEAYADALAEHRRILRARLGQAGGECMRAATARTRYCLQRISADFRTH
ncbi:MAG: hypothetical protein ABIW50_01885 [Candidatus Limnocylindria bacterium]